MWYHLLKFYFNTEYHPYFLIIFSVLCGGLIGFERQISGHREAGRRTLSLVSMGACMFTMIPLLFSTNDMWRMPAQVIAGIGFIGGGVLVKEGGSIKGMTTASAIWLSAALGICFGVDKVFLGFFCCVLAFLILRLKDPFEKIKNKRNGSNKGN